ncbi:MAG: DNA alkylation repair protein [Melioribacteraceae bacterium]|nr:DNA alkylation repair protein [Melioribacteraceae bacterium]
MTLIEVMEELEKKGNPGTKSIYIKHGAREPFFGVKVGDLKPIQKKIKKDYELAKELFDTGNSDAMYLAGLIADETKMNKGDLNKWAKNAYWYMISEYTVPWVASESKFGLELGLKWIESPKENIASTGWATLANLTAIKDDSELPMDEYTKLLKRVEKEIHNSQNRVRYTMNGFVISVGSHIKELTGTAEKTAAKIGKVKVDMGGTSCKVPYASDYILKVKSMDRIGKKKKTARC